MNYADIKEERICPVCGETRNLFVDERSGKWWGVSCASIHKEIISAEKVRGNLNIKFRRWKWRSCYTCGNSWREQTE